MTTRILVVEDEDTLRRMIARVLQREGYEEAEASNAEQALTLFRQRPFPIVLTDIVMGKMSGLDLLGEIKLIDPDALVVILPETDKQGALILGEKLRRGVGQEQFSGEECQPGGRITISVGVAAFPDDGDDAESLVSHVDQALYAAKRQGRNCVVAWEESLVPVPVGS